MTAQNLDIRILALHIEQQAGQANSNGRNGKVK